jgi:hypothetical protein
MPEVELAVKRAAVGFADVVVAQDEILGAHILDKILGQMTSATMCLFDLTGHNINVALELGLAMGAGVPYRLLYNPNAASNASFGGDFFADLKGWDHLPYASAPELEDKLIAALPKMLQHASSRRQSPMASADAVSEPNPFASYIADSFSLGTRAYAAPTYVCRLYLTVHPERFVEDLFELDDLPAVFDNLMIRSRSSHFPAVSPFDGQPRYLSEGIQVNAEFKGVAGRHYREFYRFFRNGLFAFERILPSDIEADGGYVSGDKTIGYLELIRSVTQMGRLACNLVHAYDRPAITRLSIAGLAHHRLIDDTGRHVLDVNYPAPIEDKVEEDFVGSPRDYTDRVELWTRSFIKKTLRSLNAPNIKTQTIETWQKEV